MNISFDRVSTIYDATRGLPPEISAQVTDAILTVAAATPDTQFFEPGIGTGRIALPILQRGFAYTGVDISEPMMVELRRKLAGTLARLTLQQADMTELPFEADQFDVAIAVHILHLVPQWQQALAEIRRVLKPDGLFLYTHGQVKPEHPDEPGFHPDRHAFEQQWRSLLVAHGVELQAYGAEEDEVLTALSEQGAQLEPIIAAQWRIQQTVGDLLNRYRQRMYSSCWQISDEIFSEAIARLTDWCHERFESLETDLSHETQFKIVVVRNWANSALI